MNITELRDRINNLKPLPDSAPGHSWLSHRINLRDKILNNDPEKFLTWPMINGTMFVGNEALPTNRQIEWLLKNNDVTRCKEILQENDLGKPEILCHDIFNKTSGNIINQTFYLEMWENASNVKTKQLKNIVEFGGGYGAMALICSRMGFHGQYTIIDLPEFLLLQEYYLSNVLDDISNIQFISTFDDYEIEADLMISICSLSEVDETMKNRFFEQVEINHHLIVFHPNYEDWDNRGYFIDRLNDEPVIHPYYSDLQYIMK